MKGFGMSKRIAVAFLALTPIAAFATPAPVGVLASGSQALVVRDGRIIPASANMQLFAGDRVMTRAGGTARLAINGGCKVSLGALASMPVTPAACAQNKVVSFDDGRAGYQGRSSALATDTTLVSAMAAGAAAWGAYEAANPDGGTDESNGFSVSP